MTMPASLLVVGYTFGRAAAGGRPSGALMAAGANPCSSQRDDIHSSVWEGWSRSLLTVYLWTWRKT